MQQSPTTSSPPRTAATRQKGGPPPWRASLPRCSSGFAGGGRNGDQPLSHVPARPEGAVAGDVAIASASLGGPSHLAQIRPRWARTLGPAPDAGIPGGRTSGLASTSHQSGTRPPAALLLVGPSRTGRRRSWALPGGERSVCCPGGRDWIRCRPAPGLNGVLLPTQPRRPPRRDPNRGSGLWHPPARRTAGATPGRWRRGCRPPRRGSSGADARSATRPPPATRPA